MGNVSFFDIETDGRNRIQDIGCLRWDNATYQGNSLTKFVDFISSSDFICGHNVFKHDLQHIQKHLGNASFGASNTIDTLYLSPLLFPLRPYHRLLKDDKLQVDELNNPVNDCIKARDLLNDEILAFEKLDVNLRSIFFNLLNGKKEFACFFKYLGYSNKLSQTDTTSLIFSSFEKKICSRAAVSTLAVESPIALAYSLALISTNDRYSITPPWVLHNFPDVERVLFLLRGKPCLSGCTYCDEALNPFNVLRRYFQFSQFRSYDNAPLQENAIRAAIENKSLLAVFPTGGGKSLTFQIPALMSGANTRSLSVIISPLQSLMKDQVDNLERRSITDAVAINGLLDPIERSKAIERVQDGTASLLYISPESLRSITIEKLLLNRKIARFVIDEAHCFSSWGQDFRVDYLYIGDFIKKLQEEKGLGERIPVSCFTATAKLKVIDDIRMYFKEKLDLDLELFTSNATRTNLHFKVLNKNGEEEKYSEVRRLLEQKQCPTIIYVSRTKRASELAQRLNQDGFNARPYHGKMEGDEKAKNQNAFIEGSVDVVVATSAFGMGVDKSDVGMVVHYDISDSLENYFQESGRAGRDERTTADCFLLFTEADLDKHFLLLNQTRLDIKEINQVWRAIKELTKTREKASNSALEIARKAGWDDNIFEIETRVTTAISALEQAGYLRRGHNIPRVFANSILSKSAQDAAERINSSDRFTDKQKERAIRIIKKLISSKSKQLASEEVAECRIDYISDQLGIVKKEVIEIVELLREEKILADAKDLSAFIKRGESTSRTLNILEKFAALEKFFLATLSESESVYNLKELNEQAGENGCLDVSPNNLRTLINFWAIKHWIKRKPLEYSTNHIQLVPLYSITHLAQKMEKRHYLVKVIIDYLFRKATTSDVNSISEDIPVEFSLQELKDEVKRHSGFFQVQIASDDIEDTLFYLSRIEAIKIEGGFMVVYNQLTINRIEKNNKIQYKQEDYQKLGEFYLNKIQQIHIVGEYAKKMLENYNDALQFADDYFKLNYNSFLNKYFPDTRQDDIRRALTPARFRQLFGQLSAAQLEIIKDSSSRYIVVAAAPGSGKTRVLVHKLASLLLVENVRHEQLLMLTFSRAAANEFKKRLLDLIGNTAQFIEIKTFHSYSFDLLGKMGSLTDADVIVRKAVEKIKGGDIEPSRITKSVLVVDEAQDMSADEYALITALMEYNDQMKVILVGDDDQNIYEFRGADSKFMYTISLASGAKKYELVENYRSKQNIVSLGNDWLKRISNRLKSLPVIANDTSDGLVKITEHPHGNLITPLIQTIQQSNLAGSIGILTTTNEQAVQIAGMLIKSGYPAKLIQTNDGFNIYNLAELRFFTELVEANTESVMISEEDWESAKSRLFKEFSASDKLEWCRVIIKDFELLNPSRKYKSDWKRFLTESKFEDFVEIRGEAIYVSTIHKAKGKEYDNVFLMLDGFDTRFDETKRQFYVAISRAKKNLSIHYNGQFLKNVVVNELVYANDPFTHPEPQYMSCLLTHRDVQLGYYENVQHQITDIYSGSNLNVVPDGLANSHGHLVVKFSMRFCESIDRLLKRNYELINARVNFVLYWKNRNNGKEVKILLPEISFYRS